MGFTRGEIGLTNIPGTAGATGTGGATGSTGSTGVTGATGSAAAGGLVKIAQIVTAASQTTVDFTSIPATSTDLKVIWMGRDTSAGVTDINMFMKVNNDATAADYTATQQITGAAGASTATTIASTTSGGCIGFLAGTSGNANALASGEVTIPNYAGTTFEKAISAWSSEFYGAGPSQNIRVSTFMWQSTAAITRLTFTAPTTAFQNGSTFTLYGLG